MILFINGPFGVGKTSPARVLVQKMPHCPRATRLSGRSYVLTGVRP
jgi:hypothetical protein